MIASETKMKNPEKRNIVILGGGFAGVRTALDLSRYLAHEDNFEIILVDRRDYQTYTSALYEAATTEHGLVEARKVKRTVAIPFDMIFEHTKVKVFKAYIESIDLENGKITTDSRILSFDYLVIAMGSISDFYGIPGLEQFSFTLKSLDDAIMIRNRVEEIVLKKNEATVVIGGGGFAGAEFAGELHNLIRTECRHHNKDCNRFNLVVIEGGANYLPGLPENVSSQVRARLTGMGIAARFNTFITEAGRDYIMLNKTERLDCDLLVWTGGVRAPKLPIVDSVLDCDKKDRLMVTDFLNLKKYPHVFVAGDNGCFVDPVSKKPMPQTAQEAIHQGTTVARNIYRSIKIKPMLAHHPTLVRFVIPVAGKHAVLYTPYVVIGGFIGWAARRAADLRYFLDILPFGKAVSLWMFENKIFLKND